MIFSLVVALRTSNKKLKWMLYVFAIKIFLDPAIPVHELVI
jgi:hypothetical protein